MEIRTFEFRHSLLTVIDMKRLSRGDTILRCGSQQSITFILA